MHLIIYFSHVLVLPGIKVSFNLLLLFLHHLLERGHRISFVG